MFEDFENWLYINTEQISVYVRNLHYPPPSTPLSISGHFKRFQLKELLSQLTKLTEIF